MKQSSKHMHPNFCSGMGRGEEGEEARPGIWLDVHVCGML